jgi:hypothetical protein
VARVVARTLDKERARVPAYQVTLAKKGGSARIKISAICLCETFILKSCLVYKLGECEEIEVVDHFYRSASRPLPPPRKSLFCLPALPTADAFVPYLASQPSLRYLLLGEAHTDGAAGAFLQRYAGPLAAQGFEVLGSEFYYTQQQPSLDAFHYGLTERVPEENAAAYNDRAGYFRRSPVVRALQAVGIRTVALEDTPTQVSLDGDSRVSRFDEAAFRAIDKEVHQREEKGYPLSVNPIKGGKVIVWVGAAHVRGIADLLGGSRCAEIGIASPGRTRDLYAYVERVVC